jgi:hypothetical protein
MHGELCLEGLYAEYRKPIYGLLARTAVDMVAVKMVGIEILNCAGGAEVVWTDCLTSWLHRMGMI